MSCSIAKSVVFRSRTVTAYKHRAVVVQRQMLQCASDRIRYIAQQSEIMECIAYLWNSSDCEGNNNFTLCLSQLRSVEGGAPTEAFPNETELSERLTDIGTLGEAIATHLEGLRNGRASAYFHLEVTRRAFESFGRRKHGAKLSSVQNGVSNEPMHLAHVPRTFKFGRDKA
jgi:hypothetical protein